MRRFIQSVGTQLSLALLLVVAIALGVVYLTVVPSLRERAIDTRVADLTGIAAKLRPQVRPQDPLTDEWVATASEENEGVRVVLLNRLAPSGLVVPYRDSGQLSPRLQGDPVATHALDSNAPQHGTVTDGETTYAEAAAPVLRGSYALLVRDPVELGSIRLVERRVLLAAGVALLIALLLGYGGARMFARRIRRLERAADRIANGRFDEPVVDTGGGELGALAAAFERMRVRLAHLDDARREFVANASHELRTPLFSLAGFLELLDDEELDEPTRREFLASMREQVDRLTKLASDLLDLSRLDSGRLTVAREPVDLGALAGRSGRGVRAAGGFERPSAHCGEAPATRCLRRPTSCGCSSWAGSWSRTRCCTPRRERRSRCGRSSGRETRCSRSRTRAAASARTSGRSCSSASSGSTARAPPAAASGWRSPGSWPS